MKLKLHVIITDPEAFLKGDYFHCMTLSSDKTTVPGWVNCGQIEVSLDVNRGEVLEVAAKTITEEMGRCSAAMNVLEQRKAELLALPAPGMDKS